MSRFILGGRKESPPFFSCIKLWERKGIGPGYCFFFYALEMAMFAICGGNQGVEHGLRDPWGALTLLGNMTVVHMQSFLDFVGYQKGPDRKSVV